MHTHCGESTRLTPKANTNAMTATEPFFASMECFKTWVFDEGFLSGRIFVELEEYLCLVSCLSFLI